MSSLPPKAPPLGTSSTSTVPRAGRGTRPPAGGRRRCPAPACRAAAGRPASGSASALSGSRKRCSMRCVCHVPLTTCALAASAASTSPRRMTECDSRLACVGLTCGAPGCERRRGLEHRREQLVLDVDQRRGLARGVRVDGGDGGEHVADAAHLLAFGDEARPVVLEEAVPALARHVGGGRDRDDARQGARLATCRCAARARARGPSSTTAPWSMPGRVRSATYGRSPSAWRIAS